MITKESVSRNVKISKVEIVKRLSLFSGISFKTPIEIENTYFNTIAQSNLVGQLIFRKIDNENLAFSEGQGILAITGKMNIVKVDDVTTNIKLNFRFAFFSLKFPQRLMFFLLLAGLLAVFIYPVLGVGLLIFAGILLVIILVKMLTISFIKEKISKALEIKNKWV